MNGSSRCLWHNQIAHIGWPCLVKLAILIWSASLLVMLTKLATTYLPTYLPFIYLFTYLAIYYLPTYLLMYLLIDLSTYIPTYILHKEVCASKKKGRKACVPTYLPSYLITYLWKKLNFKCCYTHWQKISFTFNETC